jgi:hypothetical protein
MLTKFRSENLKGRQHSKDLSEYPRINIKMTLKEIKWEVVEWFHLA